MSGFGVVISTAIIKLLSEAIALFTASLILQTLRLFYLSWGLERSSAAISVQVWCCFRAHVLQLPHLFFLSDKVPCWTSSPALLDWQYYDCGFAKYCILMGWTSWWYLEVWKNYWRSWIVFIVWSRARKFVPSYPEQGSYWKIFSGICMQSSRYVRGILYITFTITWSRMLGSIVIENLCILRTYKDILALGKHFSSGTLSRISKTVTAIVHV